MSKKESPKAKNKPKPKPDQLERIAASVEGIHTTLQDIYETLKTRDTSTTEDPPEEAR